MARPWNFNKADTIVDEIVSKEKTTVFRAPTTSAKLKPRVDNSLMSETALAEYRELANEVGLSNVDVLVEEFRIFLAKQDYPVFNLQEVVSYMDEIAAKDNPTKLGWHWVPVRVKDTAVSLRFGRKSARLSHIRGGEDVSASDYYESHRWSEIESYRSSGGGEPAVDWRTMPSLAYSRTLPLHALRKIVTIERGFGAGKVVFLVTDYVTAPHVVVNPDPFLMAVIPNSAVAHGKGRFIIDVWDEPGFGIERMVK